MDYMAASPADPTSDGFEEPLPVPALSPIAASAVPQRAGRRVVRPGAGQEQGPDRTDDDSDLCWESAEESFNSDQDEDSALLDNVPPHWGPRTA